MAESQNIKDAAITGQQPYTRDVPDPEKRSVDDSEGTADVGAAPTQQLPLSKRILRVIWDSLDKTPAERAFIRKVDCWIMTYVCVAYTVKYLDQTNVGFRAMLYVYYTTSTQRRGRAKRP